MVSFDPNNDVQRTGSTPFYDFVKSGQKCLILTVISIQKDYIVISCLLTVDLPINRKICMIFV